MDKILDDSLIDSDVCIKCGHCCKSTSTVQYAHPNAKEWIGVIHGENENPRIKLQWHNAVVTKQKKSTGEEVNQKAIPYHVTHVCPKLVIDEEAGTKMCGIYEVRPSICRNYNCFTTANASKRRPQNWDNIKKIIKEVHDVDVEWPLPLQKANWKDSEIEHIRLEDYDVKI